MMKRSPDPPSVPSKISSPIRPATSHPSSTSTLRQLLAPLPGVGISPSKVHCHALVHPQRCESPRGDDLADDTYESKDTKKTSKQLWFAKLFNMKSQVSLEATNTPSIEKQSDKDSSGRISRSVSLRRALSHRSSSLTSNYFTTRKRRDSLDLIYEHCDNGIAYKPPIPHPLIGKAA